MTKKHRMGIRQPPGYAWLEDEPRFDAKIHLAKERPPKVWRLGDFGYSSAEISQCSSDLAVTAPFRLLSDEGTEAARSVVAKLVHTAGSSDRIARFVRGTVYRSRFLRDLCNDEEVTQLMAELAGVDLTPHTMPLYQGHLNLMPDSSTRDVDQWHTDTVALDYVLLLTDPNDIEGGEFEYFHGSKQEAIRSLQGLPALEIPRVSVKLPGPGWALAQQGNMVVHRAKAVTSGNDRVTLVNSYIPTSAAFRDVSRLDDCRPIDPPEVLLTEWARHKAFLSKRKLEHLIDHLPFGDDPHLICDHLREAIRDVEQGINEITDRSPGRLVFYADALTNKL